MAETKLVTLKEPGEVYRPDCGEVPCKAKRWLVHDAPPLPGCEVLHLSYVSPNPFVALRLLEIETKVLMAESQYECPYTGYLHWDIVPHSILTAKGNRHYGKQLRENEHRDDPMALDFEFLQHMMGEDYVTCEPTKIAQILLGSGYSHARIVTDGHGEILPGTILLSSGDQLRVNHWEWYNK